MPTTFEEIQDEKASGEAERKDGKPGEIFAEIGDGDTFESLREKYDDLEDFLTSFPRRGQEPSDPIPPVGETPGIEFPEFDFDIDQANQTQLLRAMTELTQVMSNAQVAMLDRLNTIAQFTRPEEVVTVSGANVNTEADTPTEVISQSVDTRKIYLRASPNNIDDIYLGDDQVEPQKGWVLRPGETLMIRLNFVQQSLYMASETENQVIQILGVF